MAYTNGSISDFQTNIKDTTWRVSHTFRSPAMSFVSQLNGTFPTSFPTSDEWSGYISQAQVHLQNNQRLLLILLINTPIIAVVLNVLRQLVRCFVLHSSRV